MEGSDDVHAKMLHAMPLPPPWHREVGDEVIYVNSVTGQRTSTHPFQVYLSFQHDQQQRHDQLHQHHNQQQQPFADEAKAVDEEEKDCGEMEVSFFDNGKEKDGSAEQAASPLGGDLVRPRPGLPKDSYYDYHCQWSERDVFGKVTLYGLVLRVEASDPGKIYVKFDGMEGQWEYVALRGPYGSLELHDLYIGAKVTVFGRHLTISSVNLAASAWIDRERKRLMKQQDEFRRKIESVGHVPVVRRSDLQAVKHITRDSKTKGQVNLRSLLKENAKLGEQLSSLGLASRL